MQRGGRRSLHQKTRCTLERIAASICAQQKALVKGQRSEDLEEMEDKGLDGTD